MIKDSLGNEIEAGDKIAYALEPSRGRTATLGVYRVLGVTREGMKARKLVQNGQRADQRLSNLTDPGRSVIVQKWSDS